MEDGRWKMGVKTVDRSNEQTPIGFGKKDRRGWRRAVKERTSE
jgi:hypothetical protein